MRMEDVPATDAHCPELSRKAMLMCGSESMSSVFPDSVFVWNMRSTPPLSWT